VCAIASSREGERSRGCFDVASSPDYDSCTWGDRNAPNHMYLVGDSTALAYAPAFKALAEASDGQWRITTVGLYGCRFTQVLVQNDGAGVLDACPGRKAEVAERIRNDAPQLVVMSNAFALGQQAGDRRPLSATELATSALAEAAGYGLPGRIVQLAPPPLGADLGRCYSPVTGPQNCNVGVDAAWQQFADATTVALATAGAGDHFVSSLGFVCAEGYCPAFAGRLPVRYDTVHLTPEYSAHLEPVLAQELRAQGVF